jgi:hypothetical protein
MSHSGGPPIAGRLPADNSQPDLSSFDGSDTTQSDELSCPDDYLDAPEDDTDSLPVVEYQAPEIVHPHTVDILRNIAIIAGTLRDPQGSD